MFNKRCQNTKWASAWQSLQNGMCVQRRLRSVWASAQSDQSSLSAWRKLGSLAIHLVHSEDSDQTGRMLRLIWVFAGRTWHFVGFVMRWHKLVFGSQRKHHRKCVYQFKKGKRKVQEEPQSQTAALPRHQGEGETDKTKQARFEQTYEKH